MPTIFLIALGVILAAAILLLTRWLLARLSLRADARSEYAARSGYGAASVQGVSADAFERIYVSAHEPRWAPYAAAALAGAVLITWPALHALLFIWDAIRTASGASDVFAPGYYPWMFFMFFGIVGAWAACGWLAARIFHARAPEEFHAAIARAQGAPLDEVAVKRPRPKWARRAEKLREGKAD